MTKSISIFPKSQNCLSQKGSPQFNVSPLFSCKVNFLSVSSFLYSLKVVHFHTHLFYHTLDRLVGILFGRTASEHVIRGNCQLIVGFIERAKCSLRRAKDTGKVAHRESAKMMNICERVTGRWRSSLEADFVVAYLSILQQQYIIGCLLASFSKQTVPRECQLNGNLLYCSML